MDGRMDVVVSGTVAVLLQYGGRGDVWAGAGAAPFSSLDHFDCISSPCDGCSAAHATAAMSFFAQQVASHTGRPGHGCRCRPEKRQ
jgi:hypothetical protein